MTYPSDRNCPLAAFTAYIEIVFSSVFVTYANRGASVPVGAPAPRVPPVVTEATEADVPPSPPLPHPARIRFAMHNDTSPSLETRLDPTELVAVQSLGMTGSDGVAFIQLIPFEGILQRKLYGC